MKMNKKITASILAMTMGAGLVGSISGTVAWYQYSTRAQIGMLGMSIGVEKKLQVALSETQPANDSALWKTELKTVDVYNFANRELEFKPITVAAGFAKDADFGSVTFKSNPVKGLTDPAKWTNAAETDYLKLKVWVRSVETDGAGANTYLAKELGLSDAKIASKSVEGKLDISNAVRIAIDSDNDHAVIAKETASTNLYGPLALGNGVDNDTNKLYDEDPTPGTVSELTYGTLNAVGETYNLNNVDDKNALLCGERVATADASQYAIVGGMDLGATTASQPASFTVTIWLEGWQKLVNDKATWKAADYSGSQFFVGFEVASGDVREAA